MSLKISPHSGHDQSDPAIPTDRSLHLNNNATPPEGSPNAANEQGTEGRIPYNNNRNSLSIRQQPEHPNNPQPPSDKLTGRAYLDAALPEMGRPSTECGTYDSLQITSNLPNRTDLRNLDQWTRIAVGDKEPHQYRKVLYIDREGREVEAGDHATTIGLTHYAGWPTTVVSVPSLPALVHGAGMQVLRPEDVEPAMDRVRNAVEPYLHADLNTFQIGRLDSSTTLRVKEPTAAYIGLFHAITGSRFNRMDKKLYHGETVQFFNSLRSVGFYDKGLKEYPEGLEVGHVDGEYLRFEVQDKLRKAITSTYGKAHFADLKAEALMAKAVRHRVTMFDRFFKFNADGAAIFEDQYNLMKAQREAPGRNGVLRFLALTALKDAVTVEEVLHLMDMTNYDRSHIYRTGKKLAAMAAQWSDTSEMYEEVKRLIHEDLKYAA